VKPIILLTGKTGQVGGELLPLLRPFGEVVALDRTQMNLEKRDEISRVVRQVRPQLIINAGAYTAVDQAELDDGAAQAINAEAPGVMAAEAKKLGAALIHYSTDYVFDGLKKSPYEECDAPNPLNVYGKSKLAGEEAVRAAGIPHLIFRTSWVYGTHGKNFLLTMLRLGTEREELRIVSDQTGAPTTASYLAVSTTKILSQLRGLNNEEDAAALRHVSGTYHLTAAGLTTWYGFANAIFEEATQIKDHEPWFRAAVGGGTRTGEMQDAARATARTSGTSESAVGRSRIGEAAASGAGTGEAAGNALKRAHRFVAPRVIPIITKEFGAATPRPLYSGLSNKKIQETFGLEPSDWHDQLHNCFAASETQV
jgi:dTDP-4-dehydrorhamnose reductase